MEEELIKCALSARKNAFAPFSGSKVGVAVLVDDGAIFTGANVEFARNMNIHAEFVAMEKALKYIAPKYTTIDERIKEGFSEIVAIAEVNNQGLPGCGPCRQMVLEVNPEMIFYGVYPNGEIKVKKPIKELYPFEYRSNDNFKL